MDHTSAKKVSHIFRKSPYVSNVVYSPYLASGSTDKSIRVWRLWKNEKDYFEISEECNFTNEESGIRKIMFLKNQPYLLLAGDLVRY